jgi:UDP-N-acetylglucosamine/UDP-N-acetylgalactosamine diphosphorylase
MTQDLQQRHQQIAKELTDIGQEHVLRFWSELTDAEKIILLNQIEALDPARLRKQIQLIKDRRVKRTDYVNRVQPFPVIGLAKTAEEHKRDQQAANLGAAWLQQGRVAVLLVAGGLGSRLGADEPKGLLPIGPVSGHSLFQIHTEKILALEKRYGRLICFLIMTSESNHDATVRYFQDHDYFGHDPRHTIFFTQASQPAFDEQGKLLMSSRFSLALSPDGHGGMLYALQRNGLIEQLRSAGVDLLFYFQVDNALCRIADPVFLGHHILQRAEMASKSVAKRSAEEKVGVFCHISERPLVVEYSELDNDLRHAGEDRGQLVFSQGSIAIHIFNLDFLARLVNERVILPHHVAFKKVEYIDAKGMPVVPTVENGFKLEQFIFDALPHARHTIVLETDRRDEFSPVKNREGADSPVVARRALTELYARWLENAGISVPRDSDGLSVHQLEVSPLYALDEEEWKLKTPSGLVISNDTFFQ